MHRECIPCKRIKRTCHPQYRKHVPKTCLTEGVANSLKTMSEK